MRNIAQSTKKVIVNFGGGVPGRHKPQIGQWGDEKGTTVVTIAAGWMTAIKTTDGKIVYVEPWQVLWHELIHALRWIEKRVDPVSQVDERQTIEETNDGLRDYNNLNPNDPQPLRDPTSHTDQVPAPKKIPSNYYPE